MRLSFTWWIVMLSACAYQQSMRRGEDLAASGDWAGAYAAYGEAVERKPDSVEASTAREQARAKVIELELSNARSSLDMGDFEKCKVSLDEVAKLDPDHPEVFELLIDLEKKMSARLDYLWQANDGRGAYEIAILTRKLLPKAQHLPAAFDKLHAYWREQAEKLLKAKDHEKALAAIKTITEFEPDRQADVAAMEQEIRTAWADTLASRASTFSRTTTKIGAAAVLYARAYEIAGRPIDLEQARKLAGKLKSQGSMPIQLDIEGPWSRMGPVRDALVAGLTGVPNAVVVRSDPSITMKLVLKDPRCSEKDEKTPTQLDYVSGQVEKPNPVYGELTAQLDRARKDEATARERLTDLMPQLETAEAVLRALDEKVAMATKDKDAATTSLSAATTQLDATRTKRDGLEQQVDQLVAQSAAQGTIDQLRNQIVEATKRLDEWAAEVKKYDTAATAATQKVDGLQAQRTPALEARDRLKAGYEAVVKDRDTAKQLATELSAKLSATPKTVWEDVHELLKYELHDWTRTCVAPASAYIRPSWKSSLPTSKTFAPTHTTTDKSHIGHEKAKLEVDPKAYPETDAQLVGKGDAETTKELITWLGQLTDDGYRARIDAAIDQMGVDPIGAATPIVALYLGARGRLDDTMLGAFTAHLKKEFGLEKPELLAGS